MRSDGVFNPARIASQSFLQKQGHAMARFITSNRERLRQQPFLFDLFRSDTEGMEMES